MSSVSDGLAACLNAGADMFMIFGGDTGAPQPFGSGTTVLSYHPPAGHGQHVPMSRLDDAVRRILAVKCEMGLFDTTGVIDTAATARVGSAAHRMVARQAVQKSLVVLKNDNNVLPLSKTRDGGAGGQQRRRTPATSAAGGRSPGRARRATSSRARPACAPRWRRRSAPAKVVYSVNGATTTGATVGVAVIGETPYSEGTGDRTDLTIPSAQQAQVGRWR